MTPRRYPPLPRTVQGLQGPIEVVLVKTIEADDKYDTLGIWRPLARRIEILRSLAPRQRWAIYHHELMHATLWDSGVSNVLPRSLNDDVEEAICDAASSARMRERFG